MNKQEFEYNASERTITTKAINCLNCGQELKNNDWVHIQLKVNKVFCHGCVEKGAGYDEEGDFHLVKVENKK